MIEACSSLSIDEVCDAIFYGNEDMVRRYLADHVGALPLKVFEYVELAEIRGHIKIVELCLPRLISYSNQKRFEVLMRSMYPPPASPSSSSDDE